MQRAIRKIQKIDMITMMKTVPAMIREMLFVEVFSGTGHLSRAFADVGFMVIQWDIIFGSPYDLMVDKSC